MKPAIDRAQGPLPQLFTMLKRRRHSATLSSDPIGGAAFLLLIGCISSLLLFFKQHQSAGVIQPADHYPPLTGITGRRWKRPTRPTLLRCGDCIGRLRDGRGKRMESWDGGSLSFLRHLR